MWKISKIIAIVLMVLSCLHSFCFYISFFTGNYLHIANNFIHFWYNLFIFLIGANLDWCPNDWWTNVFESGNCAALRESDRPFLHSRLHNDANSGAHKEQAARILRWNSPTGFGEWRRWNYAEVECGCILLKIILCSFPSVNSNSINSAIFFAISLQTFRSV